MKATKTLLFLLLTLCVYSCTQENQAQSNVEATHKIDCNKESGPVCATIPCPKGAMCFMDPVPSTYNNECDMIKSGAIMNNKGPCK